MDYLELFHPLSKEQKHQILSFLEETERNLQSNMLDLGEAYDVSEDGNFTDYYFSEPISDEYSLEYIITTDKENNQTYLSSEFRVLEYNENNEYLASELFDIDELTKDLNIR